jgi:hypothetical protein
MVDLTSLIDSTMMFTIAFSIGIFMSSRQTWVKLSVGIALAMMIFPVIWIVRTTVEAGTGFNTFKKVALWKDRLLDFNGGAPEPGLNAGDGGDQDGPGKSGRLLRSRTLKEVFNFIRRSPRQRTSTSSKLNLASNSGSRGPPGSPEVEGEVKNKEQGGEV